MISDGEKEEIRSLIKVARNRVLNFGICMGEKPIETVFVMHRRNIPAACARQAKADGTTPKVAKGTLEVEGRMIRLKCEGSVPPGLAKSVKKYLKIMKLNFKVEIVDELSNIVEVEGDDDDDEQAPQAVVASQAPDSQAQDAAEVPATASVAAEEAPSEQARYEALAGPLQTQIEELEGSDHPKAAKIAAIWQLATKRAEDGDFTTAIKALTALPAHL